MRTSIDLERISTGRWRLRVRREDARGNCAATATVEADTDRIRELASDSVRAWTTADERRARAAKRKR
jgi:hypothetical protein